MTQTIIIGTPPVTIKQNPVTSTIQQTTYSVAVTYPAAAIPTFVPFKFTATQGQSVFTLSSVPNFILLLTINGVSQSQSNGDFTVAGTVITLNGTLNTGDLLAGIYV